MGVRSLRVPPSPRPGRPPLDRRGPTSPCKRLVSTRTRGGAGAGRQEGCLPSRLRVFLSTAARGRGSPSGPWAPRASRGGGRPAPAMSGPSFSPWWRTMTPGWEYGGGGRPLRLMPPVAPRPAPRAPAPPPTVDGTRSSDLLGLDGRRVLNDDDNGNPRRRRFENKTGNNPRRRRLRRRRLRLLRRRGLRRHRRPLRVRRLRRRLRRRRLRLRRRNKEGEAKGLWSPGKRWYRP